jgi:hypothetical protein
VPEVRRRAAGHLMLFRCLEHGDIPGVNRSVAEDDAYLGRPRANLLQGPG